MCLLCVDICSTNYTMKIKLKLYVSAQTVPLQQISGLGKMDLSYLTQKPSSHTFICCMKYKVMTERKLEGICTSVGTCIAWLAQSSVPKLDRPEAKRV